VLFGLGAGLTLDEFALLLDLGDVYWAKEGRSSIDAVNAERHGARPSDARDSHRPIRAKGTRQPFRGGDAELDAACGRSELRSPRHRQEPPCGAASAVSLRGESAATP
jgi:hypothetical protein